MFITVTNCIAFQHSIFISILDDDEDEGTESSDINDMSAKSAEVVIVEFFNVQSIHFPTVRKHLLPLGKGLNVKTRSLGKYDLLLPLAKALFKNGHVAQKGDDINYRNIKRNQIKVVTNVNSLISSKSDNNNNNNIPKNSNTKR